LGEPLVPLTVDPSLALPVLFYEALSNYRDREAKANQAEREPLSKSEQSTAAPGSKAQLIVLANVGTEEYPYRSFIQNILEI
jgi:hypothetical protein